MVRLQAFLVVEKLLFRIFNEQRQITSSSRCALTPPQRFITLSDLDFNSDVAFRYTR
jgi:hypothetical protein